jgi:hypothetical protein
MQTCVIGKDDPFAMAAYIPRSQCCPAEKFSFTQTEKKRCASIVFRLSQREPFPAYQKASPTPAHFLKAQIAHSV